MKCKDLRDRLADFLLGGGDEAVNAEINAHLAACRECSNEYESLSRLWEKLGMLGDVEPSKAMRARFYSMLDGYKDGIELSMQQQKGRRGLSEWLGHLVPAAAVLQFALAALLLIAGAVIGRIFSGEGRSNSEMAQLRDEVHNMRQMVTISLLQQQSASERLAGVSWSQRVRQPDEKVLSALVHTLNYDPSVDVRLAAVDALYQFSNQNLVRKALVESLSRQLSPLVQIALIDLMVDMREKQSEEVLRRMANDNNVNETVRERAKWGLQRLS